MNDCQSTSTPNLRSATKTSFLSGMRSVRISQLAVAAILIPAPFSYGQVKAATPEPKTASSGMLPAIGSTGKPKAMPHQALAPAAAPVSGGMTLTAYSADGVNAGTARLGRNVTLSASAPGQSAPTYTWNVQGAGTISSAGVYTAPAGMPSNSAVTITAALTSNPAITASYALNLIYSAPTIMWVTPSTLLSGETNSVAINGYDFTAQTTLTVGGVTVPTVFNGTNGVIAQIPVDANVTSALPLVASNPTPGGGAGATVSAQVKLPAVTLNAYSADGTNAGTARLGRNVSVQASIAGMTAPSMVWSVQGAGSINSAGTYTAPVTMPPTSTVKITGALASNPAVSSSYTLNLIYAAPTVRWVIPAVLNSGQTNSVQIGGDDFTPATVIKVGGSVVPTVFQAPNQVIAQIPVATGASSALSIVASNPNPGGGNGVAVSAAVQSPSMTLTGYSMDGTNSGTARLGRNVTVAATVAGNANPSVNWSVQGAGTISPVGVYTAPLTMPSNSNVTIVAKLASNSSVTASYPLQLVYTAPTIHWITPLTLTSGMTNSVQVGGLDFTAATTIAVNGTAVPAVFQAPNAVVVQIPIAAGSVAPVSIVASNPTPGGGSSAAITGPVSPITVAVSSYSTTGVNPSYLSLGQAVQFSAAVTGGSPTASWPVTWSVQGAGSISSTGLYKGPASMPSNPSVVVTATLASNQSISKTYALSLLNPTPVVNQSQPVEATAGSTGTYTFLGGNFTPSTIIEVNGQTVSTKYLSPTSVSATIAVAAGTTGSLSITAVNSSQAGGQSTAFMLSVGDTSSVQATVGTTPGQAIPGDFVGFSHEWGDAQQYMGTAKTGVNTIYRQLVKNLTNPGTPFLIRIGGSSTDQTAEPTAWTTQAFSELFNAMPVKFSLGVNLGSNNVQLAADQTSYFTAHMPSGSIAAIELGNEPDAFGAEKYRPSTYDFSDYLNDFAKWNAAVTPLLPKGVKLAGPSLTTVWHLTQNLPALEQAEGSNISMVTAHYYGGYVQNVMANDYLLQDSTATKQIVPFQSLAATAHSNGQLFRINETNSADGGGVAGLSNTFGAALWAADVMFGEASVGVDGVNWHGVSGCNYCAFTFGSQPENGQNTFRLQQVNPLYYGLLFFHEATANSAQLLPVTVTTSNPVNVKVWSTVDASGTVHVAILNKDSNFTGTVAVTVPGYGQATVVRMVAANANSQAGITIGGQTFDNSFDGNLIGTPMTESFTPTNSVYKIPVQPMSAVLLTLTK